MLAVYSGSYMFLPMDPDPLARHVVSFNFHQTAWNSRDLLYGGFLTWRNTPSQLVIIHL